ncbi:sterol desaturase family protein [Myxococcota bacterium]|nr:sterol desaturase family protein [Myxococcota bacterium]
MTDWILPFLAAYIGQSLGFLAVVSVVFFVVWRLGAGRLAGRRIRARGRTFDGAQLRHELKHTAVVLAIGTAQLLLINALNDRGWTQLSQDWGPWGAMGAALTVVGLVLFNDLWFYSVHRVLHTPWLFRRVHAVHHRSADVNPFSSYSFHAVEGALLTAWLIPAALLVPLSMPALMVTQLIGTANNLMAHLGYELLPVWWIRAPGLRWTNTATFHSLHHTQLKGNYGLFTRLWDRLLGTELSGYEAAFVEAHPPEGAAP